MKVDKNQDADAPLRLKLANQLLAGYLGSNKLCVVQDIHLWRFFRIADGLIEFHNATCDLPDQEPASETPPTTPEPETKAPDGPG